MTDQFQFTVLMPVLISWSVVGFMFIATDVLPGPRQAEGFFKKTVACMIAGPFVIALIASYGCWCSLTKGLARVRRWLVRRPPAVSRTIMSAQNLSAPVQWPPVNRVTVTMRPGGTIHVDRLDERIDHGTHTSYTSLVTKVTKPNRLANLRNMDGTRSNTLRKPDVIT